MFALRTIMMWVLAGTMVGLPVLEAGMGAVRAMAVAGPKAGCCAMKGAADSVQDQAPAHACPRCPRDVPGSQSQSSSERDKPCTNHGGCCCPVTMTPMISPDSEQDCGLAVAGPVLTWASLQPEQASLTPPLPPPRLA